LCLKSGKFTLTWHEKSKANQCESTSWWKLVGISELFRCSDFNCIIHKCCYEGLRWWAGEKTYRWSIVRYRTFQYLEPTIKPIIIIVIFSHMEIWFGYVISLCYLMYIIILWKYKMMLMCSYITLLIQKCNND
jgi:hypothetical protein